jgi:hypothetical protein
VRPPLSPDLGVCPLASLGNHGNEPASTALRDPAVTDTMMTLLALLVAGNLVLAGAFSLVAVATD